MYAKNVQKGTLFDNINVLGSVNFIKQSHGNKFVHIHLKYILNSTAALWALFENEYSHALLIIICVGHYISCARFSNSRILHISCDSIKTQSIEYKSVFSQVWRFTERIKCQVTDSKSHGLRQINIKTVFMLRQKHNFTKRNIRNTFFADYLLCQ